MCHCQTSLMRTTIILNNFKWTINGLRKGKKRNNNVLIQNRFMPLSVSSMDANDDDNDVSVQEDDIFHNNINTISQMPIYPFDRQTSYVNRHPERGVMDYRNTITVPGNSDDHDISKDEKKVCILSDSICHRIKMKVFNKHLKNKKAYKLCFPGGDT